MLIERLVWPHGKVCAAMLSVNLDAEFFGRIYYPDVDVDSGDILSLGRTGMNFGLRHLLDAFDQADVKATFFIPGENAEHYPEIVKQIHARGHEIAYHGYHHYDRPVGDERDNLARCEKIFADLGCDRPYGYRPTEAEFTDELAQILLDRGYEYVSYRGNFDGPQVVELNGKKVPLVDLEADVFFDDTAYDYYIDSPPCRYGIATAKEQCKIWQDEFDGMALEGGRVMDFVIHPQFMGRAARVNALAELIGYMRSRGAWITTNREIARYVLQQEGLL